MKYHNDIQMNLSEYLDQPAHVIQGVKAFIYGLFISLDIPIEATKILMILMLADTFLGIIKAVRLEDQVSFKTLLLGFVSKISVLMIPLIIALVAQGVAMDLTWMVHVVLDVLIINEAFSSLTNILSIREKRRIQNTDFIALLINKLKAFFETVIGSLTNKFDN